MRGFILALCLFLSVQLFVVLWFWFVEGYQLVQTNNQLTGTTALVTIAMMAAIALSKSNYLWRLTKYAWHDLNRYS